MSDRHCPAATLNAPPSIAASSSATPASSSGLVADASPPLLLARSRHVPPGPAKTIAAGPLPRLPAIVTCTASSTRIVTATGPCNAPARATHAARATENDHRPAMRAGPGALAASGTRTGAGTRAGGLATCRTGAAWHPATATATSTPQQRRSTP